MKGQGVMGAKEPAKKGEITLTFENVKPGTYAITVMHDTNDNRPMDLDSTGIPEENYATSGDMKPYGPPVFENTKFEITDEDEEFRMLF